jgi:lipopolysaccharide export LptBFGC system permease protein LptF
VNRDVPVITPAGGSSAAYNDPNSPESIMRKTTQVQAQSVTDTRFDVPADAFTNYTVQYSIPLWLPLFVIVICLIALTHPRIRGGIRTGLLVSVCFLLLLSVLLKKNEQSSNSG